MITLGSCNTVATPSVSTRGTMKNRSMPFMQCIGYIVKYIERSVRILTRIVESFLLNGGWICERSWKQYCSKLVQKYSIVKLHCAIWTHDESCFYIHKVYWTNSPHNLRADNYYCSVRPVFIDSVCLHCCGWLFRHFITSVVKTLHFSA